MHNTEPVSPIASHNDHDHEDHGIPLTPFYPSQPAMEPQVETPIDHHTDLDTPISIRERRSTDSTPETLVPKDERTLSQAGPSTILFSNGWLFLYLLVYMALAVISWVYMCVLRFRPLSGGRYQVDPSQPFSTGQIHNSINEYWYRASRVIAVVVAVLTIPITNAVCSGAAAAYSQRSRRLTLRQTMVLADRGWASPKVWLRLIFGPKNRRAIATPLLLISMALLALGMTVPLLQEILLTRQTIKAPVQSHQIRIPDVVGSLEGPETNPVEFPVALLRSLLSSTQLRDPQQYLWDAEDSEMDLDSFASESCVGAPSYACHNSFGADGRMKTFAGLSSGKEFFFSPLPVGFNTGLWSDQLAPRMNWTTTYSTVGPQDFPATCAIESSAFYAKYAQVDEPENVYELPNNRSVEVCILRETEPEGWDATRDRQDRSEELFIKLVQTDGRLAYAEGTLAVFKVAMNSTLGYFELPNYGNGGVAGKLLKTYSQAVTKSTHLEKRKETTITTLNHSDPTVLLRNGNNLPLFSIAIALFGTDSFPETLLSRSPAKSSLPAPTSYTPGCIPPLLLLQPFISPWSLEGFTCSATPYYIKSEMLWWLELFSDVDNMQNTFTAAAYLSAQVWAGGLGSREINYDMGSDIVRPVISVPSIIVISTLLGVFLLGLVVLTIYALLRLLWTPELDPFAMMRIGASVGAEKIPLDAARRLGKIECLDQLPGWVGDVAPEAVVGKLGLGAESGMEEGRRFTSYPGDDLPATEQENNSQRRLRERSQRGIGA